MHSTHKGDFVRAFLDPYLVSCRLPYRRAPGCRIWPGNGLCLVSRQEIPCGLDRLVFLWAASMAKEHGPRFCFRPRRMFSLFGVPGPQPDMLHRLERVSQTHIEIHRRTVHHRMIGVRVAVNELEIRGRDATMALGTQFAPESLIPVSRDVIAGCVAKKRLAALDLYLWQMHAAHGGAARTKVPVFGPGGLYDAVDSAASPVRAGKVRQQLRRRQALIRALWPACPHVLGQDGNTFVLEPWSEPI